MGARNPDGPASCALLDADLQIKRAIMSDAPYSTVAALRALLHVAREMPGDADCIAAAGHVNTLARALRMKAAA